ncbi:MAG TPA: YafY family protein [Bryobacteraceae bacterium]|nr:YafY family protein [Bryobacteraceae bacterium]
MRRADRLFQIVQHLRLRRTRTTARELARKLAVSERTIYRDIQDLGRSGVPIEGEAGVGYILRGFDVPPLMFTREEIEALVVGARMVEAWTTEKLSDAARQALQKIEAALPERLKAELNKPQIYAVDLRTKPGVRASLDTIRQAIAETRRLEFDYQREDGEASRRGAQPLGLYFWGNVWTLAAWCELRRDFRSFRLDRMSAIAAGAVFERQQGRTLEDFLARVR